MAQTHVINSLQLEMDVSDQDMAFRLRNRLSDYWQEWLVADLEKACEKISTENEVIRLERLEIDLGEIEFEELEEGFSERLEKAFTENLIRQIGKGTSAAEKTDSAGSNVDLLSHFLETGKLPWWSGSSQNVNINLMLQETFNNQPQLLKQKLIKVFREENQLLRLVYQFDSQIVIAIFSALFELSFFADFIKKNWLSMHETRLGTEMSALYQSRITAVFLMKYIQQGFGQKTEKEMAALLDLWWAQGRFFENTMTDVFVKTGFFSSGQGGISLPNSELAQVAEEKTEKHFIRHAGIILAAPFLTQLFKKLNFLAETGGGFKDDTARIKAVYLTGYLSANERHLPEYELILEKAICGLDLTEPIPWQIELSDAEVDEADALLKALVEHWEILKSVEGLQQSFLQREGILYNEGSRWKLRVERKAFDVLFDHKPPPWGFRLLSFSWNKKLIETEW